MAAVIMFGVSFGGMYCVLCRDAVFILTHKKAAYAIRSQAAGLEEYETRAGNSGPNDHEDLFLKQIRPKRNQNRKSSTMAAR